MHLVGFYYKNDTGAGPNFIYWYLVVCRPRQLNWYSVLLRAGQSGDLIPVGAIFPTPVQTDSGLHPASYTMGTGSFRLVKRPGRGVDHPPPYSADVKKKIKLHLYLPLWAFVVCFQGDLYLLFKLYSFLQPFNVRSMQHVILFSL